MRFASLFVALGAFTAAVCTAADTSSKEGTLLARTGPEGRLSKRQAAVGAQQQGNTHAGLRRKMKRAPGTCKPKSSPPTNPPVHLADPPKEEKPKPEPKPEPARAPEQQPKSQPQEPQKQTPPPPPPAPPAPVSPINEGSADAKLGRVSSFQGTNSGIMSWFLTSNPGDSTNGESWCQTRYKDDWMCFAPSLKAMMSNFGYDYKKATKAYCGREVEIEYNGKKTIAFICDAFDDRWVRTPGSIDATKALFTAVYGSFDGNKNTVAKDTKWRFTGRLVRQGEFQHGKYWH